MYRQTKRKAAARVQKRSARRPCPSDLPTFASMRLSHRLALAAVFLVAVTVRPAAAQEGQPRFGIGFNTLISTADGLGVGFRGRASAPVNQDLSVGVDLGFTGFVLEGRRRATYVFDPQLSLIVTIPQRGYEAPYFLGGIGAYLPLASDHDGESGPFLHLGVGRVRQLNETVLFYEINPALIVAYDQVHLAVPLRAGVIF